MPKKKRNRTGLLKLLILVFMAPGFSNISAETRQEVVVRGLEEGGIHFEPVTPEVVAPGGYSIEKTKLNGEPYEEREIAEQGLHELLVTVSNAEGETFSSTTRFIVLDSEESGPVYTVDLVDYHVERLSAHPHVKPAGSADERFVLGKSAGWPEDPEIPPHDLYGFTITDPDATNPKLKVVLVGGNHPREQTGSWGLHGALDFLTGPDPRAGELRRRAVFYVYPMVNPDGRKIVEGRSNPEMLDAEVSDHNRVWNTEGKFSTIDTFVEAMHADTGGSVDYLLDFHSASNTFFYTAEELMESPFARAMTARDHQVRPRLSEGQPGMIRIWGMTEDGLDASFAYTPEFAGGETAERSLEIGRSYMLVFHDLMTGQAGLAAAAEALDLDSAEFAFGNRYRDTIPGFRDRLENLLDDGADPVEQILPAVYELYEAVNDYRAARDLGELARERIAESRELVGDSQLDLATWIAESLPDRAGRLAGALAEAGAELDRVEALVGELEERIHGFRYAKMAESAVEVTRPLVREPREGFGELYRNAVVERMTALERILGEPGTDFDLFRDKARALDFSVARYWRVGRDDPHPPVRPVRAAAAPEVIELNGKSDWKDGLLVNVAVNETALAPAERPGLQFDGDGAYVETGFYPGESVLGQSFTWEFWKLYREFADDTGSSGSDGTEPRFYTQLTGSEGGLRAAFGDRYWNATTLEEPGRWYHIAFVFEEGEVKTYVDGELRDTRTGVEFSGDSSKAFSIGRGFREERYLDGFTREHRIWNTARTAAEIRRERYRELEGTEDGLVAAWPLNEGDGHIVHDLSPSENHGEVHGASWRARTLPGYRLSQPVAVSGDSGIGAVTVSWKPEAETLDGDGRVRVLVGISESSESLPEEWRPAGNGEPMAVFEDGGKREGGYLWMKQELFPDGAGTPPRLESLTLRMKD